MGSFPSTTTTTDDSQNTPSSSDSPISTDSQNPNLSVFSLNPNMSSSDNNQPLKQTPESSTIDSQKTLESNSQNHETQTQSSSDSSIDTKVEKNLEKIEGEGGGEEEEEEEGECGFCLFMKGGGCKESFIAWENCVEESEKNKEDVVEKCFEVTSTLRKCMEAHADYYEPILRAEKAAQEEAIMELEKEKAAEESKDSKGNVGGN